MLITYMVHLKNYDILSNWSGARYNGRSSCTDNLNDKFGTIETGTTPYPPDEIKNSDNQPITEITAAWVSRLLRLHMLAWTSFSTTARLDALWGFGISDG